VNCIELIYEDLRRVLRYEEGKLYKLISEDETNGRWKQFAGQWVEMNTSEVNTNRGYVCIRVKDAVLRVHRVIYCLFHKTDVDQSLVIDHKNGIKTDNHPDNLLLAPQRNNCQNKDMHREGKLCGCTYNKRDDVWRAQIHVGGKPISLGAYPTELEASEAYHQALSKLNMGEVIESYTDKMRKKGRLKGTAFHKNTGKWAAAISYQCKRTHLGLYATEQEAHDAYNKALTKLELGEEIETEEEKIDRMGRTRGVIFHKATGKWQASIAFNGKKKYLGVFVTEQEAREVYAKALREKTKAEAIERKAKK
jgi:hypothetical protein